MKVYFDENYSKYIAQAFNLFEYTHGEIEVYSTIDALRRGATDLEIVKYVSNNNGVLFTKDKDFKKVQLIIEMMKSNSMGLFFVKTPKKENYWDIVEKLTKSYRICREEILKRKIPYYYEIKSGGKIEKLNL